MNLESQPVIDVRDLWRFYGRWKRVEAVRGVSLHVDRGEIFGLIGPDGAGKTSIIQVLAGVLAADRGSCAIDGIDVAKDPETVKTRVGYMPQGLGANLYESLSAAENIEFFRGLRKLPEETYRRNRAELLRMTRLEPFIERRARDLSGGMRQKLALICTLIHLPEVILLDEPTTGVDPISRQEFWQIIRRLVEERRVTVLLSTSYMDEAERCHRIGLVHSGQIFEQGTPESIRGKAVGRYARLVATPQMAALRVLEGFRDVSSTEVIGDEIHIRYEMDLSAVESALKNQGIEIRMIEPAESELEDVFLELLGAAKHAKPALHVAPPGGKLTQAAVESHRVTRRFNDFVAVDSVDLQVRRGEILGLLGPNGAGKTTLIKMMCGLLEPSSGEIHVAGFNIRTEKQRVWREIGYMSQRFSLYRDLSVQQNLRLYSDLYGISNSGYDAMTESLGLVEFRSRLAGDLPIGVRQRLSLLCAVLHGPQVLFLDEPTSGVDPPARRIFWDLIYSLSRESAVTVLVSTHYMDEADHCDRLGLMDQGRLIALDSPSALKQISERSSGKLLTVRAFQLHAAWDAILPAFPGAILYGTSIRLRSLNPWSDERRIQMLLGREGIERARISEQSLSMDETFIDFIRTSEASHA